NIFWGHDIIKRLRSAASRDTGASIFGYWVNDPERYGVVEIDDSGKPVNLVEKPEDPVSNYAVTGLYFYDKKVCEYAHRLKPSARGELEITDLNRCYLEEGSLNVELMGRGVAWLDTGTHDSMLSASNFVSTIQKRQGLKISCPEEIAYRSGFIEKERLYELGKEMEKNEYGRYLMRLAGE
ncbi:MAG: sugar nucleotidyltransferase, partial [Chitinivibrionales bacterium]